MSVRTSVITFLETYIAAQHSGPLMGIPVNDTPYAPYTGDAGISVWFVKGRPTPNIGQTQVLLSRASLPLIAYARVTGTDKTARSAAVDTASAIALAAALAFFNDPTIGGAVRDSQIDAYQEGGDSEDGQPYAVATLALVFNETGQGYS